MIPRTFHAVKRQDFTIRSTKAYKRFLIQKTDLYSGSLPQTGSGYRLREALWTSEKLKLGTQSETTYPTNSFDGTYKNLIWFQLDSQYYRFPYDKCATLEHSNKRFSRKFLNYSASVISLPYFDFGEEIKPGSVEITGSIFNLTDDQNGNIYDVSLNTGSYSQRKDLVAYWGFNHEFRKGKLNDNKWLEKTKIEYESSHFEDVEGSICRNINFPVGVPINNTGSGTCANFDDSYIFTPHKEEFNFSKIDDFTIGFWVRYETNPLTDTSVLISKNTIIRQQEWGLIDKPNQNGGIQPYFHESQSTIYKPIDVYPFRFEINNSNGKVSFKRSDGTKIVHLSGSSNLADNNWHYIAGVKSGSNLYLYQDGTLIQSGSEVNYHPLNKHSLIFGSDNFQFSSSLLGKMDEIRIYNKGLSQETIQTLSDSSSLGMYQSSVVGNAFYKSGNIVISSFDPKHNQILDQDWKLRYRGTHTIYNYEAMVRIKKGWFNHTTNPTVRRSPNSDLLIDDVTGSLKPYFHTILLCNDNNEVMAIGKMNQAIQLRDDANLNVIVKFDG